MRTSATLISAAAEFEPTTYQLRRDRIGVEHPRGCTDTGAGDDGRAYEEAV